MEFSVDPTVLERAQVLVGRVADDLVRERRSLDGSVSGLLAGGWSGVAAEEYQRAWEEWRDGADEVLTALHSMGELLGRTRVAYLAGDDDSVRTVAPLGERLRERLS